MHSCTAPRLFLFVIRVITVCYDSMEACDGSHIAGYVAVR
jgi:hypothetical protein